MARKGSGGGGIVGFVLVALALTIKVIIEYWPLFLILAVVVGIAYFQRQAGKATPKTDSKTSQSPRADTGPHQSAKTRATGPARRTSGSTDEPVSVRVTASGVSAASHSAQDGNRSYTIPRAPAGNSVQGKWLPPGESVNIQGFQIDGGMLYVGGHLKARNGNSDPALIDPLKPVDSTASYTVRLMDYWPSYSTMSSAARGAYLRWLANGRKDPAADVGYVFVYFYGLERRLLLELLPSVGNNVAEIKIIRDEFRRLLSIYGGNYSFQNYCGHLLQLVELALENEPLYLAPIPDLPATSDLPIFLRLAIGQAVRDSVPLSAELALAWAERSPMVGKRTPYYRCKEQFYKLFPKKYEEISKGGLRIKPNKTKLQLTYKPASSGFSGANLIPVDVGNVPDVTVLTQPTKVLQAVVDACDEALSAYSRYLGRNPDDHAALEALLNLPVELWPNEAQSALRTLCNRVGDGMVAMTLQELAGYFKATGDLNKERLQALARALEKEHIGIEPDVLSNWKAIKPEDTIVLFHSNYLAGSTQSTTAYRTAMVTLELAAAVAHADGDFSASELRLINSQIDSWVHLTPGHILRLKAKARLLMASPIAMASIKKKLEGLDETARSAIGAFAALMVNADGVVSPEEVKILEKIYQHLGFEKNQAYAALHAATTASMSGIAAPQTKPGAPEAGSVGRFELDAARIEILQRDSEKVSKLLAGIFAEEAISQAAALEPLAVEPEVVNTSVMGLDALHSAFVRVLKSRPSWQRPELQDVADDMNIMLDGALEQVNDAAFDHYDGPLTEGDNPIDLNPEILEKLSHDEHALVD